MIPAAAGFVKGRKPEKIPFPALIFAPGQSIIKWTNTARPKAQERKTGVLTMEQRITDFFEMLRTKRVGLVGFGVTNNGIAKMLDRKSVV